MAAGFSVQDRADWKNLSVTQAYLQVLQDLLHELEQQLIQGETLNHSSAEETLALTARLVGRADGLSSAIELILSGSVEED